jgi:hypothetical protein
VLAKPYIAPWRPKSLEVATTSNAQPSSPNATMGISLTAMAAPSRRKRRHDDVAARSGKPDLGFPPAPNREKHGQSQDHASKEKAVPTGIAVASVQSLGKPA